MYFVNFIIAIVHSSLLTRAEVRVQTDNTPFQVPTGIGNQFAELNDLLAFLLLL